MLTLDASFDDIDQMCESVRAWDLDFQPLASNGSGSRIARLVQLEVGSSLFGHARFHAPLQQAGAAPKGLRTFVIQEPHMRGLWWRGHDVVADQVLAFPLHGELSSVSGSDFDIHTVSVTEEMLAKAATALELSAPRHGHLTEVFSAPKAVLEPIRLYLRRVRDGLTATCPGDVTNFLMALLPHWLSDARDGPPGRPAPKARARAIRMSLELIESTPVSELNAERLRHYAGVSERTLQVAFRDRFDLTPAAFIKARKLAAVRATLKHTTADSAAIGDIAAAFGFWHSGQFAADYRRAFGELPSATLDGKAR